MTDNNSGSTTVIVRAYRSSHLGDTPLEEAKIGFTLSDQDDNEFLTLVTTYTVALEENTAEQEAFAALERLRDTFGDADESLHTLLMCFFTAGYHAEHGDFKPQNSGSYKETTVYEYREDEGDDQLGTFTLSEMSSTIGMDGTNTPYPVLLEFSGTDKAFDLFLHLDRVYEGHGNAWEDLLMRFFEAGFRARRDVEFKKQAA